MNVKAWPSPIFSGIEHQRSNGAPLPLFVNGERTRDKETISDGPRLPTENNCKPYRL